MAFSKHFYLMYLLQTNDFQPEKLKTVNCVALTSLPVRSFRQSENNQCTFTFTNFSPKVLCNLIIIYNSHHTINKQTKKVISHSYLLQKTSSPLSDEYSIEILGTEGANKGQKKMFNSIILSVTSS